jgi:hypothetical protein
MPTKIETRAWNATFEKYMKLRNSTREQVIQGKAADFAFKVYKHLPPVEPAKIEFELLMWKTILRLTWYRLSKKFGSDVLKGKATSKRRRAIHKTGKTKKALTPGNKLVRDYARKLMASRKKSAGYHRVAFLLLGQKLVQSAGPTIDLSRFPKAAVPKINPRSRLTRTNFSKTHNALRTVVRTNAIARGLECPSTNVAVDRALADIKSDMEAEIIKRLAKAKREAGFK